MRARRPESRARISATIAKTVAQVLTLVLIVGAAAYALGALGHPFAPAPATEEPAYVGASLGCQLGLKRRRRRDIGRRVSEARGRHDRLRVVRRRGRDERPEGVAASWSLLNRGRAGRHLVRGRRHQRARPGLRQRGEAPSLDRGRRADPRSGPRRGKRPACPDVGGRGAVLRSNVRTGQRTLGGRSRRREGARVGSDSPRES